MPASTWHFHFFLCEGMQGGKTERVRGVTTPHRASVMTGIQTGCKEKNGLSLFARSAAQATKKLQKTYP
jgi:hypothetical protein